MLLRSNEKIPFFQSDARFERIVQDISFFAIHTDRGNSNFAAFFFQSVQNIVQASRFPRILCHTDNGYAFVLQDVLNKRHKLDFRLNETIGCLLQNGLFLA
jgi:hypothetical protein